MAQLRRTRAWVRAAMTPLAVVPLIAWGVVWSIAGWAVAGWGVAGWAAPARAEPHDSQAEAERAQVERELAQTRSALEFSTQRASAAAQSLAEANLRLPEAQRHAAQARGVLTAARAVAQSAERAADHAAKDLAAADLALAAAVAQVDRTRAEIGRYAADAYKGSDLVGVQAMLSARNPADVMAGLTYLDQVAGDARQMLGRYTLARAEAANIRAAQAQRQRATDDAQRRAELAVRAAEQAGAQAARAESEAARLVAQRTDALQVAEEERAGHEERLAELAAESGRIAARIHAMAARGGLVLRDGARLPMPVQGWKSSDFGLRFDPFYQVWQLHAGVDLAAPAGAPIWAAESGTVLQAGWHGGYGNYVCIYHGKYLNQGFATCYAHQSAILVSAGQQVHQGQVIGRVGTTGASTGNHLHFEVRLDGAPVDPLPWLPQCLC